MTKIFPDTRCTFLTFYPRKLYFIIPSFRVIVMVLLIYKISLIIGEILELLKLMIMK